MFFTHVDTMNVQQKIHQITAFINNPSIDDKFECLNTTSVHILLYQCIGIYGKELKELSLQVIEQFISWIEVNKTARYLPSTGIDRMYHPQTLRNVIRWCKSLPYYEKISHESFASIVKSKYLFQ